MGHISDPCKQNRTKPIKWPFRNNAGSGIYWLPKANQPGGGGRWDFVFIPDTLVESCV